MRSASNRIDFQIKELHITSVRKYPGWPKFSREEAAAAHAVISSNKVNYWTGMEGREFEKEYAAWIGTKRAIAVANGTLALDLALKALGIGPGDEVVVTPRTFIASVSSVVNAGAIPIFADVDRESGNISSDSIAPKLTEKTRAIVPVHLAGWPCDMPGIMDIANQHDLVVIEDCAQAHGAKVGYEMVGSIGHIGAWSFCQDKIMTTGGEGGMVTTNDEELWEKMWSFKDHGKSWDAVYHREHPPGFRFVHESIGTNWRMLEVQSAIGRLQLDMIENWTAQRTKNANMIVSVLKEFDDVVRIPMPSENLTHAYYRLYAYVKPAGLKEGWDRDRIVAEISATGAPIMHGTCSEVYLEKAFDNTGFRPSERLPNAFELGETSLMFMIHPTLREEDIADICSVIRDILTKAAR